MSQPAARQGDMTAHGGTIAAGFPQVLIGGQPAARVGDMHICPMVTPGTPPVPHVGGPILPPGGVTVLIGGQPAARQGDMAMCTGPPDVIAAGCPTVLIGG
ncbi:MAG: type VI secretion protein [Chloroflexi bacterium]|nr:type VI secretion protein [Chloroflexota bacterium]